MSVIDLHDRLVALLDQRADLIRSLQRLDGNIRSALSDIERADYSEAHRVLNRGRMLTDATRFCAEDRSGLR